LRKITLRCRWAPPGEAECSNATNDVKAHALERSYAASAACLIRVHGWLAADVHSVPLVPQIAGLRAGVVAASWDPKEMNPRTPFR
jgi:hypothetical protein